MTLSDGYLFWVADEVDPGVLGAALAGVLSVAGTAVDVGASDADDRHWERPVLCGVTRMSGDLRLHLDIYVHGGISLPSAEDAAAGLAARLHTLVAYQSVTSRPDAFWLVGPDGRRTRARLDDGEFDDDDRTICRVAAVEMPVESLPDVPVAALTEVIREYRMPIPLSTELAARLRTPPETGSPLWHAVTSLKVWESMVARLVAGWPPDGWYPPECYREDLESRNELVNAAAVWPAELRTGFATALEAIDRAFAAATEDDDGAALAARTGPVPPRWWWRRITRPLPWRAMPGN